MMVSDPSKNNTPPGFGNFPTLKTRFRLFC